MRDPQARPVAPSPLNRDGRLPTFVIVGAMRSGTTTMARQLGTHPDVFMAAQKEVHFFDVHFARGVDWYRYQFRGATRERAIGEATPNYLDSPKALERMAAVLPDPRLIAILRNPIDRAYSHYWHNVARGRERLSFEEAISAEKDRLERTQGRERLRFAYQERGLYARQLEILGRLYPREAIWVGLFEDFRADPLTVYRELFRFLGVDDSFVPLDAGKALNRYVRFRSSRLRDLARRLPSPLKRVVGRLNVRRADGYPPMEPLTRKELLTRFREDNAALAAWLGRDLAIWEAD